MHRPLHRRAIAAIVPLALAAAVPASASAATAFYGVTSDNRLTEFTSDNVNQSPSIPLRGLAAGENVVGIDLRPADGRLYAMTNQNRLVIVNARTGAITRVGNAALTPPINGASVGFDFNPVRDRIRLETNAQQNLRIDPATGQLETVREPAPDTPGPTTPAPTTPDAPAATTPPREVERPGSPDQNLAYVAGDAGAGTVPRVGAVAYSNSFPAGSSTELFVLDAARNALAKQDPENAGTLRTVGSLGTTTEPVAFDIGPNNVGWAALASSGGRTALYRVDLRNGKATREVTRNVVGTSRALVALAAAGEMGNDTSAPGLSVSSSSTQMASRLLAGGLQLTVNCDEACDGDVRVRYRNKTIGRADTEVRGAAGYDRVAVRLDSATRTAIRRGSVRLDLRVEVADGAGNRSSLSRPIRTRD